MARVKCFVKFVPTASLDVRIICQAAKSYRCNRMS